MQFAATAVTIVVTAHLAVVSIPEVFCRCAKLRLQWVSEGAVFNIFRQIQVILEMGVSDQLRWYQQPNQNNQESQHGK